MRKLNIVWKFQPLCQLFLQCLKWNRNFEERNFFQIRLNTYLCGSYYYFFLKKLFRYFGYLNKVKHLICFVFLKWNLNEFHFPLKMYYKWLIFCIPLITTKNIFIIYFFIFRNKKLFLFSSKITVQLKHAVAYFDVKYKYDLKEIFLKCD